MLIKNITPKSTEQLISRISHDRILTITKRAIKDYIKGWEETHLDEKLSFEEARVLCVDSEEDISYSEEKPEYLDWVATKLEDWAQTFDELSEPEDPEEGEETHEEVSERIWGYAQKIREEKPLNNEETYEILFHLWQENQGEEE
jgi:hypothetical protein